MLVLPSANLRFPGLGAKRGPDSVSKVKVHLTKGGSPFSPWFSASSNSYVESSSSPKSCLSQVSPVNPAMMSDPRRKNGDGKLTVSSSFSPRRCNVLADLALIEWCIRDRSWASVLGCNRSILYDPARARLSHGRFRLHHKVHTLSKGWTWPR